MAVVLAVLFTAVIMLVTWWYMHIFKLNRIMAKYPGPRPLPIVGNAHKFGSVTDFLPAVMDFRKQFGNVYKIFLGFRPRLIVADPEFAEFLLGSTTILEKSYEYKFFYPWLGTGLLTSSSEKWKRQRKLITPTFHFQILEQFVEIFNTQGDTLITKLRKKVGEKPFDIFPYVTLYALDIICEAAMGTSVCAQNNSESDYVHSVKEMCRMVMERGFSPIKMWDFLFTLSPDYHIQKKALKILHGYTNSVIASRKEQLSKTSITTTNDEDTGIKKRLAFLDLLLQSNIDGQPVPDEVIREEVNTFMFEGHDTTTSGISFILYCLSQHPDVQEKVVDELRTIFTDDNSRACTYKDLQEMKYLDIVIKETMRLFPPVPTFARLLEEDVVFDGGVLPKGLAISVVPYALHRHKEYFPDPEKFDPDRFSPENTAGRNPFAYLPFSAGPRNCIGQRFAVLEMKAAVSKVLRNFEVLPVPEHQPILAAEAVLKSVNGLLIRLKQRDF